MLLKKVIGLGIECCTEFQTFTAHSMKTFLFNVNLNS